MKVLVCGDIHGKVEVMNSIGKLLTDRIIDKVVFVGDFLDGMDSHSHDEMSCIQMALDWSENHKAICIYGNHELSYTRSDMRCSRYSTHTQYHMDMIHEQVRDEFVKYTWVGNFLVTHAGLSYTHMLNSGSRTVDDYLTNHGSYFYQIGFARHGFDETGGIFWNDFYIEFKPIPDLKQIFGHSRVPDIDNRYTDNYCIDCLHMKPHALVIDDQTDGVRMIDVAKGRFEDLP